MNHSLTESANVTLVELRRTSMTMRVDVIAERGAEQFHVTEAEGVYVAIDPSVPMADRRPIALFPA